MNKIFMILGCLAFMVGACAGDDPIDPSTVGPGTGNGDADTDTDGDSDTDTDTDTDSDTDVDTDADADGDTENCVATPHDIKLQDINMLILLDRSASMEIYTYNDQTYQAIVAEALSGLVTDPANELVNFGLIAFPAKSCPPTATSDPFAQCLAANEVLVPIGPNAGEPISQHLSVLGTCGGTPICDSLKYATQSYLLTLSAEQLAKPTFVLLATDGAPNCSGDLDMNTCTTTAADGSAPLHPVQCLDDVCANGAAKTLFDTMNIQTFVVGVGDDVGAGSTWAGVMTNLAANGSGGTKDYFAATDPASLSNTFKEIIADATPCTFDVVWEEIPGQIGVTKGCKLVKAYETGAAQPGDTDSSSSGTDIPARFIESTCGGDEGWFWQGMTEVPGATTPLDQCLTIELCPASCQRLKYGEMEGINFEFGCLPPPV